MGCELEAGAPGVPGAGTQTALEGELSKAESTIEALRTEIARTPETDEKSKQTTENTVVPEDKESGEAKESSEAKADYESVKESVQFDTPGWMALGKLAAKDVTGRAGFEGIFVNTPSSDGGTGQIVTGVAEVTYSTGAVLPYVKGEQPPNIIDPIYSPALVRKLEQGDPGELVDIVLNLKDDLILTPLPRFKDAERGSDEWKKIDAVRQVEIDKIKTARKIQFGEFRDLIRGKIKFEIVYIPWIANTPIITVSLDSVKLLAELDQVINISLNVENSPTQGPDGDAANDMLDVRQQLRTTPYDNWNLNWGYLAVIDSGIRLTHDMVDDQNGDWSGDCFNSGNNCWGDGGAPNGAAGTTFPAYSVADTAFNNSGHGTPIKAGISGSADIAAELRGITQVTTDSWKAVDATNTFPSGTISRALQKAVDSGSNISTNSYGGWGSTGNNPVFDNMYDLGMGVFVAANNSACESNWDPTLVGNPPAPRGWRDFDCTDNVARFPGISFDQNGVQMVEPAFGSMSGGAHKAITVGAHEIDTPCSAWGVNSNVCSYSGRGPALDGRYKPDILGYTNWESGRANTDNATGAFGGTSAATPSIAAMAQIYNNFLEKGSNFASWLSPGHVYATVLGSGEHQTFWEGSYNYIGVEPNISTLNIEGVGRPRMFVNGTLYYGSAQINDTGDIATVNLKVPDGACGIQSAIWWPEGSVQFHSDIDIHLVNPDDLTFAAGQSGNSVWERASINTDAGLAEGNYKARILGFDVKQSQQVFYAIHVQKSLCWDG